MWIHALPPGERRRPVRGERRAAVMRPAAVPLPLLLLAALPLLLLAARVPGSRAARVALIGDYGDDSRSEAQVATLVRSWDGGAGGALDAVVTAGDNNYPYGKAGTIEANVGKHYSWAMNDSPSANRFWPCPGNHDWGNANSNPTGLNPYLAYFKALGGKRYYDKQVGSLHFFLLDSDSNEPDGRGPASVQAGWLQGALNASSAPFKVVVLHHAPFSSGQHGSNTNTQWPYEAWGADAVIAGHDHHYERLLNPKALQGRAGFPYFVNGLGGASIYAVKKPLLTSSQFQYTRQRGAQLLRSRAAPVTDNGGAATRYELDIGFVNRRGKEVDCYRIVKLQSNSTGQATTSYGSCSVLKAGR